MAFSQRLSVRMFLSQSHLHEPFIRNACILPPLLQNLYDVLTQHPKRDQNLKFTPLSETTSTPARRLA